MERKKPMRFSNWPMLSPQRPRSPSSACSSSSGLPSFSSDITEFYDAAEDWSESIEQESAFDYRHPKPSCTISEILRFPNLKAFQFKKLKLVTNNFHHDRVIGEEEFGHVYKGWIHEKTSTPSRPGSGMAVAVKIWRGKSLRGHKAWQTELFYLGQLRHPNIVKLIGFCSENKHLALVYEYFQGGSLDNYLFKGDIMEFNDAAEDLSENIEQAINYRERFPNLKAFTFQKLKRVTNNFHRDRLIGRDRFIGGSGRFIGGRSCATLYKGWIHENTFTPSKPGSGMAVAVKVRNTYSYEIFKPNSHHLSESIQHHTEWQTELFYLGQLRHPNIVKLIGVCSENKHLALVYEYVQRGSLDNYLSKGDNDALSWAFRIKVAIGIAKALSFLHDAEFPTIFRDVKSSNVLLDEEFNAKLTGFGLAIAGPAEDEAHISTDVYGTDGYADPEYVRTGDLHVKSDVYGFGVVLLELLSGLRVDERYNLVGRTKPYLGRKEKLIQFIDPKLEGQYPEDGANEVAKLALQCLKYQPKVRPHMSEVLTALEELQHPLLLPGRMLSRCNSLSRSAIYV